MNHQQIMAFSIVGVMMLMFIWGRIRYDVVAMLALLVSVATGIVPAKEAFSGFSDDIVIIVASALVVSTAVSKSQFFKAAVTWLGHKAKGFHQQLFLLVSSVTVLSAFVKNVGALAMMMPVALKMAKRSDESPSRYLMPMSFGSLMGGLSTLIGTSPNIIVSGVREEMTGKPFRMFDYAPVGIGLSVVGVIYLMLAYRLLPTDRRATASLGDAINISDYSTEARVAEGSHLIGQTLGHMRELVDHEVEVTALLRGQRSIRHFNADTVINEGDVLFIQGQPDELERVLVKGGLELVAKEDRPDQAPADKVGVIEAVVTDTSALSGRTVARAKLFDQVGVTLIAISRAGFRHDSKLSQVWLQPGDVLLLQGPLDMLADSVQTLGLLPLAERNIALGSVRTAIMPILILAAAMILTATGLVPVAIAFFAAAVLMILTGSITADEAYHAIEWPILVLIGALIPVSGSLQATGGTELIGQWLSSVAIGLPVWGALALILVAAMAVTPFLNNAATVLVMAPIAATFANSLGYQPEAFLMAVAVGAGCDFLTPIGHQNNTLVMGPGGYRFGDYARLGAPLSILVVLVGTPLILMVWGA